MKRLHHILCLALAFLAFASCIREPQPVVITPGEIEPGEAVMFTTLVPDTRIATKGAKEDWQNDIASYKPSSENYEFTISMYKEEGEGYTPKGNSKYRPVIMEGEYSVDGTLANSNGKPLYWEDNVSKWGFSATAGTSTLQRDQTTQAKWLKQDRLLGYSYLPIWDEEAGKPTDNIDALNCRTSKQWYADNKLAKDLSGIMAESNDDYKKIPIFLKHQRSWITVILKAGEGVTREALAYATSAENIKTTIYSYATTSGTTDTLHIHALPSEAFVDYPSDKNGDAATHVSTTRYDAIVEPHNFIATTESQETHILARINVSNQNFTFAAANDLNYAEFIAPGGTQAAKDAMKVYNLEAGKHLTITATLSRASRIIMITAWIEDWTEAVTQTICDDYGQNGDPILINDRDELIAFLTDPDQNKPGNVGMIVPNTISLFDEENHWDGSAYSLKATLNLAGTEMFVDSEFVGNIERTGSIINGEVHVADTFNAPSAICNTNHGTIERVKVVTSSETSPARASVAGIAGINYGTIFQCSSALQVYGTTGYVGGIAGQNLYEAGASIIPVIDACTATARVDGADEITAGGGIVGRAEGRVSNNTNEFGITLLQDKAKFQNVIASIGGQGLTTHINNAWPTTARYTVTGSSTEIVNRNNTNNYDAVIDNEIELKELLRSGNNLKDKKYQIANSFTVLKEDWIWGEYDVLNNIYFEQEDGTYSHGNLRFILDGNGKTITLSGATEATMLFGNIWGEVYDLNLLVAKPMVADRIMVKEHETDEEPTIDSNTDAIAAFCYSVTGNGSDIIGQVRNVAIKAAADVYIQASTPAGLAVWATHGGVITGCASNVPVRMHLTVAANDKRSYAGGIVACAQNATITQCKYYADHGLSWALEPAEDVLKAQSKGCRYGGIVGGTTETQGDTTPSLSMSDCYSWWQPYAYDPEVLTRPVMGSLIGSTVYHDPNDATKLFNAMAEGNAGNWWTGTVGAGYLMTGVTEEKAIGRKNSVVPSKPVDW